MRNKTFLISIIISVFFAVIPFVMLFLISDYSYPKLPVEIMNDSNYYYSRTVEIAEGNFFIGNQYIKENRNELSPSFFVGDWLWSIPVVLGLSIQTSIIVNQIFWFIIFGVFLYYIFLFFGLGKKHILWATCFVFLFIYWYLARPVAMQIIYPIFLIWITSLILYLREPESKRNMLFLFFSTTISIYVYTYLAQIIFITFSVLLFATFFQRFKKYIYLWAISVSVFFVSIPFVYYTWKQIHHLLYFETFYRIGLVNTHMLGTPAITYSLILFLVLFVLYFLRNKFDNHELLMISSVSISLFLSTISNVFTGKDLEIAVHVGRFVELWGVLLLCFFIQKSCNDFKNFNFYKKTLFFTYTVFVFSLLFFQTRVWTNVNSSLLVNESYYAPLEWLSNNTLPDSVVFADDEFSSYVPVVTHNYVLFHPNALLQLDSDQNIKDRYLASRIFQNLEVEDIKKDMRKYAGAGYTAHRHMVNNRRVRFCRLIKLDIFGIDCGQFETQYSLMGEKYFFDMKTKYDSFKKNPIDVLKKYNVLYVVYDEQEDSWSIPSSLKLSWEDDRFKIYKIN